MAKTAFGRRSQEPPFEKEILGVGTFGKVVCVHHKDFGTEYDLKTVIKVSRMPSKLICALVSISGTRGQETEVNENNGGLRVERGALSHGRGFLLMTDEAADVCCHNLTRFTERDGYLSHHILGQISGDEKFPPLRHQQCRCSRQTVTVV